MLFCTVLRLCVTNDLIRFYFVHVGIAFYPVCEFSNSFKKSVGIRHGKKILYGCGLQTPVTGFSIRLVNQGHYSGVHSLLQKMLHGFFSSLQQRIITSFKVIQMKTPFCS